MIKSLLKLFYVLCSFSSVGASNVYYITCVLIGAPVLLLLFYVEVLIKYQVIESRWFIHVSYNTLVAVTSFIIVYFFRDGGSSLGKAIEAGFSFFILFLIISSPMINLSYNRIWLGIDKRELDTVIGRCKYYPDQDYLTTFLLLVYYSSLSFFISLSFILAISIYSAVFSYASSPFFEIVKEIMFVSLFIWLIVSSVFSDYYKCTECKYSIFISAKEPFLAYKMLKFILQEKILICYHCESIFSLNQDFDQEQVEKHGNIFIKQYVKAEKEKYTRMKDGNG